MSRKNTPKVYCRLDRQEIIQCIKRGDALYACRGGLHPNNNPEAVHDMDVFEYRDLLKEAKERTVEIWGLDFIELMCGRDTPEELVLRMMQHKVQLAVGANCRVRFFVRDRLKEAEIEAYRKEK